MIGLREVPAGRSWFYSKRTGFTVTLIEHRVTAKVVGSETHPARRDYVQRHEALSHPEATRLKRKLCAEGLFYAGGPL